MYNSLNESWNVELFFIVFIIYDFLCVENAPDKWWITSMLFLGFFISARGVLFHPLIHLPHIFGYTHLWLFSSHLSADHSVCSEQLFSSSLLPLFYYFSYPPSTGSLCIFCLPPPLDLSSTLASAHWEMFCLVCVCLHDWPPLAAKSGISLKSGGRGESVKFSLCHQ